jgi:hypothetical protein
MDIFDIFIKPGFVSLQTYLSHLLRKRESAK